MENKLLEGVFFPPIVEINESLNNLKEKKKVRDTFEMCQAVPPYATFRSIREALSREILSNENIGLYTPVEGIDDLRNLLLSGKNYTSFVTAGANAAIYLAFSSFFSPGDEVLLLTPYYFNHQMALVMLGLKPRFFSLQEEDNFQLKSEKLISFLESEEGKNIKGVVLVTPNNPTGAMYKGSELEKLMEFVTEEKGRDIEVLVDETYRDFDDEHLKELSLEVYLPKNLTLVGSFSKSYALTGYRVGYLIHGTRKKAALLKVYDTMSICTAHVSQRAAFIALSSQAVQKELREKKRELADLQKILVREASDLQHFKLVSCGPYFAYLAHPFEEMTAREAGEVLFLETGMRVLPGTVFGADQEKYLRLAYCNVSPEELKKSFSLLKDFDDKLSKNPTLFHGGKNGWFESEVSGSV